MYFQVTELRQENDDLKTQVETLLTQQNWFTSQITLLQQNDSNKVDSCLWHIRWLEEQVTLCQQQYGECFNNYMFCCKELVEARDIIKNPSSNSESTPIITPTFTQAGKQECMKLTLLNPESIHLEWNLMLSEDLEGVKLQTRDLLQRLSQEALTAAQEARQEALTTAQKARQEALTTAQEARQEALTAAQEAHQKALTAAQEAHQKALTAAQEAALASKRHEEEEIVAFKNVAKENALAKEVAEQKSAKLQSQCKLQQTEIEKLKRKVQQNESGVKSLLEQHERLQKQQENKLEKLKKQHESEIEKLKKQHENEIEMLQEQLLNQKETIRDLQKNVVGATEKLADANQYVKKAKSEVYLATDLSNGLNDKCVKLQKEHREEVQVMTQQLQVLQGQLENQKNNNIKLVKRAVEQQKTIKKLSKNLTVQFSVDKETTEQVISESYQDLHKFIQEKHGQVDQILSLVAYFLVHFKFVLQMKHDHESEQSAGENSSCKEFFSQLINHIERVFLLIPVSVLLKNVDRLSELALKNGVNIKTLHFLQYQFPKSAEDAIASRQRVVLDNFPELSSFFLEREDNQGSIISMPVRGFMMLMGLSK